MTDPRYEALYDSAVRQTSPGYLIRASDRVLLYANRFVRDKLGYDPAGRTCHKVFMGQDAPCPFCPEGQPEGECYRWEYFASEPGRLYSVTHQFTSDGGVSLRACRAEDVSDIMHLSRSVVDYLSLTKFLSDMQARIIGDQNRTLEIVMEFLRSHFRAQRVAVSCPGERGLELYLSGGEGISRQMVSGEEPELSRVLAVPPAVLRVGERTYEFRLIRPANPASWEENRQAVLCIVQLYLENAQLQARIEWENHHDKATALYNRAHFMHACRTCYAALERVGVIFLDVDNLKKINDEHGHDMGDRLIKKAADVLHSVSGERVHAYCMGGDEFLLVCCGFAREEIPALLEQVTEGLDTSNELIPMPQLSISAGWAHAAAPFRLERLVTQADKMMYAVKRAKKAARS